MVTQLHEYLDIFIAIAATFTIGFSVIRFYNRKLEKKIIDTMIVSTEQIRTNKNGGQSLNDVNKRVSVLHDRLEEHIDTQIAMDAKRDIQHQELKYELAAIKRIAGYGESE